MGNQTCSLPRISNTGFEIPQLKARNSYGVSDKHPDERMLKSIFPASYEANRQSMVLEMICKDRDQLFQDIHFRLNDKQSLRLSVLFNFQNNRSRIYTKREETDITSFIQLNIEFSYLATVFYLLSSREAKSRLLPRLLENQETNPYGAYSAQLYCNGEKHHVIIDDRMPTHNDNFLYLRVVKGIELWPLLLEKAWCKMIGSYQRAAGLSPEDAFEQITGIPAYTYTIRANNRQIIKSILLLAMRNGYWVSLIARNGLSDVQNRQVFHLESIDMDEYRIKSPYVSYNFERYPHKRRGEVIVKEEDIFSHFQHVVVGFNKDGYVPVSLKVQSKAREEIIFQLTVKNIEQVSIRFNQLFNGYFRLEDRANYQYSPLLIELYKVQVDNGGKQKCKIVDFCQGCPRSIIGSRSSQCSANIMERMQGKYLIRLQIDWLYEGVINEGNLVVYGSEGNIQLTQLRNTEILFKEVYPDIFEHDGTNSVILHEHNLQVHTFDKEKTTLIQFHNVTSSTHHFQADFSRSKNLLIRGKEVKGDQAFIRLKADEKTIIQVLPKDMKKRIEIQNFQIHKIPVKE